MRYRRLGRSGTLVSGLCLGAMTFGKEADESTSFGLLDRFVDAGGNFVDTADIYQHGGSEEIIGRWLARRGRREDLVLATKLWAQMGPGRNDAGLSAGWMHRAAEASLRRLGTDYLDLYQAHAWDPLTPLEETLQAFDDLVRAGKVRYVGVSNFTGWQVERVAAEAARAGLAPVVSVQAQYNLLVRDVELEILPVCRDRGLGLLAWGPLSGGWLTGKFDPSVTPGQGTRVGDDPDRLVDRYDARSNQRTRRVLDALREVAGGRGASIAQVALAWLGEQLGMGATIVGARNLDQLEDNLGAAKLSLGHEEISRLTKASAPDWPEYYQVLESLRTTRLAHQD